MPVQAPLRCSILSSMSGVDSWAVTSSDHECGRACRLSRADLDFWKFLALTILPRPRRKRKAPRVWLTQRGSVFPGCRAVSPVAGAQEPLEAGPCPGENSSPGDRSPEAEEKQGLDRRCPTRGPDLALRELPLESRLMTPTELGRGGLEACGMYQGLGGGPSPQAWGRLAWAQQQPPRGPAPGICPTVGPGQRGRYVGRWPSCSARIRLGVSSGASAAICLCQSQCSGCRWGTGARWCLGWR